MMYKLKPTTEFSAEIVYCVENDSWIPSDPANTDYQQYLEWVAEGNTPEPWQPEGGE